MWENNAFSMFLTVSFLFATSALCHPDTALVSDDVDNSKASVIAAVKETHVHQPSGVSHDEQPDKTDQQLHVSAQEDKVTEADDKSGGNSKDQTTVNKPEHLPGVVNSPEDGPIKADHEEVVLHFTEEVQGNELVEQTELSDEAVRLEDILIPGELAKLHNRLDQKNIDDDNSQESSLNPEIAGISILQPIDSSDSADDGRSTVSEEVISKASQSETIQSETASPVPDPVVEVEQSTEHVTLDKGDTIEEVKNFIDETAKLQEEKVVEKKEEPPAVTISEEQAPVNDTTAEPTGPTQNVELPSVEIPEIEGTEKTEDDVVKQTGDSVGSDVPTNVSDPGDPTPDDNDFPSFGEWAAKVLAEEEKTKQEQETLGNMPGGAVPQKAVVKQNRNNFASRECGAKILAANPEAQNTKGILNGNKDDYMTNPCTAKKWFVLELCEPVQVRTLELASFELFSSQPRTFRVSLSDRYPAKEWRLLDTFHPTEERAVQSFTAEDDNFSKYVKVEMVEHFREEHYCPITLFRVFGVDLNYLSDDEDSHPVSTSQDPDTGDLMISTDDEGENPTNLFESAKDTVISLVKKVLKVEEKEKGELNTDDKEAPVNGTDTDAESTNLTSDGFPLPCVPEVNIPVRMPAGPGGTDPTTPDNTSDDVIQPQTPLPIITVDQDSSSKQDQLVTKLEDHEQLPSYKSETEPLVTLIDWEFYSNTGNKEMASFCTDCWFKRQHNIAQTSEGRQLCVYFDLLWGSQRYTRSCLEGAYDTRSIKASNVDQQCEGGAKKNVSTSHNLDMLKSESEVVNTDESGSSGEVIFGSDIPITVDAVPQNSLKVPESSAAVEAKHSVVSVSDTDPLSHYNSLEQQTDRVEESPKSQESSIDLASEIKSTTVVDQGEVTLEDSSSATQYPQPGSVVIPTVVPTLSQDVATDILGVVSDILPENVAIPEIVGKNEHDIGLVTPSELEASYDSSPLIAPEKISVTEILSATTTPELPPLTSDSSVVSSSPPDEKTGLKTEADLSKKAQEDIGPGGVLEQPTKTESPPEPSDVSAVNHDSLSPMESASIGQDNNVVDATNLTGDKPGDEGNRDLNLIRVPVSPHLKRETAIMRLNNRLKALELNVSLSSRFLEELSKRYRKQSEEMMKLFNKTMVKVSDTNKIVEEKDQRSREQMGILEARIDNLTSLVHQLANNMDSLNQKMTDRNFTWAAMEVLVVMILLMMSWRRNRHPNITPEIQKLIQNMPTSPGPLVARRRNSSTATVGHSSPQHPMVKHSSESALDTQTDLHIVEPTLPALRDIKQSEGSKKKKKKRHKNLESKLSSSGVTDISPSYPESPSPSGGAAISTAGLLFGTGTIEHEDDNFFEKGSGAPNSGGWGFKGLMGKPRSNSHSGPVCKLPCQSAAKSESTSNGVKCPLKRVSSDSSSTSISSGQSDKDFSSDMTLASKRGKASGRPLSGHSQGHGSRGSKASSKKGTSGHRNIGARSCNGQTHTRALSDGGLTMQGTSPVNLNPFPTTSSFDGGGGGGKILSDVTNGHQPSSLQSQKRQPPKAPSKVETLHANGHSSASHDSTEPVRAADPAKPQKLSSAWRRAFSIK